MAVRGSLSGLWIAYDHGNDAKEKAVHYYAGTYQRMSFEVGDVGYIGDRRFRHLGAPALGRGRLISSPPGCSISSLTPAGRGYKYETTS